MKRMLLTILAVMTLQAMAQDTLQTEQPEKKMSWLRRTIRGFSYIDENYVEPQHYNWSVMLQATHTYDYYRLSTSGSDGQSVWLSPEPNFKVGPYFGWRWVFAGYTFDLKHVDVNIKDLKHLYYIFNHQRCSYPAAFAQSTIQKISCGSWMVGVTYTQNSIEFDHEKLQTAIDEHMGLQTVKLDSGLMFNSVKYYNSSASVGYAYNWVFAKNCLFCSSLSLALAYKSTHGESRSSKDLLNINNFNIDGIGRFGLVYNNMRWYAGASVIVRSYNYHKSQFAANNIFGSLNLYVGYNFGARGRYKKNKE